MKTEAFISFFHVTNVVANKWQHETTEVGRLTRKIKLQVVVPLKSVLIDILGIIYSMKLRLG